MARDSRVSSFGVGGDAGEAFGVSPFEGEGEVEEESEVNGARVVGSGAYIREVVDSAR